MLKSFIRVQIYSSIKTCNDRSFVWPKKKVKLNEFHNGVHNMITFVYELQNNVVVLPTGVHYRDDIADNEDDLPSIFDV